MPNLPTSRLCAWRPHGNTRRIYSHCDIDAGSYCHHVAHVHEHTSANRHHTEHHLLQALRTQQPAMRRLVHLAELHLPQAAGVRVLVVIAPRCLSESETNHAESLGDCR